MYKLRIVGVVLTVLLAVLVIDASSASAVSQILVGGATVGAAGAPFEITGEVLLEDMGAPLTPDILCSFVLGGTISQGGVLGFVEFVLELDGILNMVSSTEDLIECTSSTCSNPVDVIVEDLPWHIELVLMAAGAEEWLVDFLVEAGKTAAFRLDCNTIIGLIEDLCEGLTSAVLKNTATDIEAEFNVNSEAGDCTVGGVGQDLVESEGVMLVTSTGGTVQLSDV